MLEQETVTFVNYYATRVLLSNTTLYYFNLLLFSITGIDFCETAIELCHNVHSLYKKQFKESCADPCYLVDDILESKLANSTFDIIFDKGTLDSVALVSKKITEDNITSDLQCTYEKCIFNLHYFVDAQDVNSIFRLLRPGGHFMIISCNHSQDELTHLFGSRFTLEQNLAHIFNEELQFMVYKKTPS